MKSLLFALLGLTVMGCGGAQSREQPDVVIELAEVSPEISPFFMRQLVTVTRDGDAHTLDAVIQYDGTTVRTVFLDPASRPAVVMEQTAAGFKAFGPQLDKVSFDPRWVMQVIGAALLLSPLDGLTSDHVERSTNIGSVQDTAAGGVLIERVVAHPSLQIDYIWDGGRCPAKIAIRNTEQQYLLDIVTLQCGDYVK